MSSGWRSLPSVGQHLPQGTGTDWRRRVPPPAVPPPPGVVVWLGAQYNHRLIILWKTLKYIPHFRCLYYEIAIGAVQYTTRQQQYYNSSAVVHTQNFHHRRINNHINVFSLARSHISPRRRTIYNLQCCNPTLECIYLYVYANVELLPHEGTGVGDPLIHTSMTEGLYCQDSL